MAKVSAALLANLRRQRDGMRGGVIIDLKGFKTGRYRLLPTGEDAPGVEYVGLFFVPQKKSTASALAYGVDDPVVDLINKIRQEGTKEEYEQVSQIVRVTREFWLKVVDREDMGDAEHPKIKILRAKRTAYQQMINLMIDTEEGEDEVIDLLDPTVGRDIRLKRVGEKLDTEWTVKYLDPSPISPDKDYVEAVLKANEAFDVRRFFYPVNKQILQEIYMTVSGEDLPESYVENFDKIPAGKLRAGDGSAENDEGQASGKTLSHGKTSSHAAAEEEAEEVAEESTETATEEGEGTEAVAEEAPAEEAQPVGEEAPAEEAQEVAVEPEGGEAEAVAEEAPAETTEAPAEAEAEIEVDVGSKVQFKHNGAKIVGTITNVSQEGEEVKVEVKGPDGTIYEVTPDALELPEAAPKPAAPKPAATPKPAAPVSSKPAPKPAGKPTAAKTPVKPSTPVAAKTPVKPAALAPKGKTGLSLSGGKVKTGVGSAVDKLKAKLGKK